MGSFLSKAKDWTLSFMKGGFVGWLADTVDLGPISTAYKVLSDIWLWALIGVFVGSFILAPELGPFIMALPKPLAVWMFPGILAGFWWGTSALKVLEATYNIS